MGADGFAERARLELLATGEKVRRRSVETRADLAAQEAQIARVVREGRTNPEIAAELFLSPRTVEWHPHKVFGKLGVKLPQGTPRPPARQSQPGARLTARRSGVGARQGPRGAVCQPSGTSGMQSHSGESSSSGNARLGGRRAPRPQTPLPCARSSVVTAMSSPTIEVDADFKYKWVARRGRRVWIRRDPIAARFRKIMSGDFMTDEAAVEADIDRRVQSLLAAHDPATTDPGEFLGARFDAGLAWVHFADGSGGLGLAQALQARVDAALEAAGAPGPAKERNGIGLGMAAPTIAAFGTEEQQRAFPASAIHRGAHLLPAVQRAGRRLGSGRAGDPRRPRRRRLDRQRAEGVDVGRAERADGDSRGPHRPGRAQACRPDATSCST